MIVTGITRDGRVVTAEGVTFFEAVRELAVLLDIPFDPTPARAGAGVAADPEPPPLRPQD